ncbi:MAG: SDR family NAD(P)-dependent oxidoreductase [Acidimicrobiia bacterium]
MHLRDISAIVTGGASGIGAATARTLNRAGAMVTIIDVNEEAGEALSAASQGEIFFVAADVTSPSSVKHAVEVASDRGPLRVAINCAGIAIGERSIGREGEPADLERFSKVIQVNLLGTYNVATHAAAAMSLTDPLEHHERGVIINTASVAAYEGQVGQTAYSASKGAIVAMTLPMARDLASVGVRVNTIAPGIIDTPLLGGLNAEMRHALESTVPFPKRLGSPDDFASLALAIIDNGYLNGETIRLDGALRMAPR